MPKPRVMIVDEDISFIVALQFKFVKEFFNKIELEIITERKYFEELFSRPQSAEILIISDELYDSTLQRHNISHVFVMTEHLEEGGTEDLTIDKLAKYTNVNEIFYHVLGKSASTLKIENTNKKETQIILITSANGGMGKTTIAMGVSACLSKNYKRVLYINASRLQCFQHMLGNCAPLSSPELYTKLSNPNERIYAELKHTIRKEIFSYLPAFKASLMSVGLKYSVYAKIALSAKKSGDYDYIVIDAESTFDEEKTRLLDLADRVIVVTGQSVDAVEAANALISNINGAQSDKYVFICNRFEKEEYSALIVPEIVMKFTVSEYIDKFKVNGNVECEELSQNDGIRKVSYLVL